MERFQNKSVVVTGAASGIGQAVALRLASEGARLALIDYNAEGLEQTKSQVEKLGAMADNLVCDLSNEAEVTQATNDIMDKLNDVHALSHNAGIAKTYNTHEMTLAQFSEIINVNLVGTFLINRALLPHLLKNDRSYIVNMSSIAEHHPHPWMSAYAASKGGIKSFTRSLFIEYHRQGLRANCICPGSISSNIGDNFKIPDNADADIIRYLTPYGQPHMVAAEHVAGVIAMMCSDDAWHMNGTEVIVDGGRI
jgi:NAD(P)-dependent dehydrogenase (short-subunit alcohol dehydrogenase family)